MAQLTEADFKARCLWVNERNELMSIPAESPKIETPEQAAAYMASLEYVTSLNSVAEPWRNMIASSLFLFRILGETQQLLEVINNALERDGNDEAAYAVSQHLATLHVAKRFAIEGSQILNTAAK